MPSNPKIDYARAGRNDDPAALFAALLRPDNRRALGRAITHLETRPADELTDLLLAHRPEKTTFRLAVSGTPGVGKSTFVEAFGLEVIRRGHRLAVLAVDPSSALSGGSILGDKTRMEELSRHPAAYVRPSPNSGYLGGVGRQSRAAVLACEAAGYDYVIVETVGVGQAEWRAHGLTDAFLLLTQPAAGDDLQGIKRGIMELADVVVVNKQDLLPEQARITATQLRQSLHLAPPRNDGWTVKALLASALTAGGIPEVYDLLGAYAGTMRTGGHTSRRRTAQLASWLRESCADRLSEELTEFLREPSEQNDKINAFLDGRLSLSTATDVLLADFIHKKTQHQT